MSKAYEAKMQAHRSYLQLLADHRVTILSTATTVEEKTKALDELERIIRHTGYSDGWDDGRNDHT